MRAVGKVLSGAGRPSRAAHAVLPTASGGNAMVARLLESGESSSAPGLDLAARITALRGGGKPLPAELRAEAESGFGTPLGDVHLHDDAEAAELASLLGARAFTSGNDIFFNSGEYNPSTPDGYELLAHELTHTLQQSAGPSQGRAVAPGLLVSEPQDRDEQVAYATARVLRDVRESGDAGSAAGAGAGASGAAAVAGAAEGRVVNPAVVPGNTGTSAPPSAAPVVQRAADGPVEVAREGSGESSLLDDLIPDFIVDGVKAAVSAIPGYTMLTQVIGSDPITHRPVHAGTEQLVESVLTFGPFGEATGRLLRTIGVVDEVLDAVQARLAAHNLTLDRIVDEVGKAWDELSVTAGVDGNVAVVRRHLDAVLADARAAVSELVDQVIEAVRAVIAEVAEPLLQRPDVRPVWELAKKVLHHDPLRGTAVEAPTVEILGDFLKLIGKEQTLEQLRERGTLQQAADWLDTQFATFVGIKNDLVQLFTDAWRAIQPQNLPRLLDTLPDLAARAVALVRRIAAFTATIMAKALELVKQALIGPLGDRARRVTGFPLLTVIIGQDPFTGEPVPRNAENLIKGFITLLPGGDATYSQLAESGVIGQAAARIEGEMARLGISADLIVNTFRGIWDTLSLDDLLDPLGAFQRILNQFGEPLARIVEFVGVVLEIVVTLIIKLMNFPTELVGHIIDNVVQAVEDIKKDPVQFLLNMMQALKTGFLGFIDGIGTYLLQGLGTWLTRGLGQMGITIPAELNASTVLDVVLQVLGVTTETLWQKLGARIGEEKVGRLRAGIDALTGAWAFIKDVQEQGVPAIYHYVADKLGDLWNTVLDMAMEWITKQVIEKAVTRLVSMLDPTGIMAVVRSCQAFFNAVQSAIEYIREILQIVDQYTRTIAEVAKGNIQPGAEKITKGFAEAVPVAIGFLANQVGIGNVPEQVVEIVKGLRKLVDDALEWLFDKAMQLGQAALNALTGGAPSTGQTSPAAAPDVPEQTFPFELEGHQHTLFGQVTNGKLVLEMSSPTRETLLAKIEAGSQHPHLAGNTSVQNKLRKLYKHVDAQEKAEIEAQKAIEHGKDDGTVRRGHIDVAIVRRRLEDVASELKRIGAEFDVRVLRDDPEVVNGKIPDDVDIRAYYYGRVSRYERRRNDFTEAMEKLKSSHPTETAKDPVLAAHNDSYICLGFDYKSPHLVSGKTFTDSKTKQKYVEVEIQVEHKYEVVEHWNNGDPSHTANTKAGRESNQQARTQWNDWDDNLSGMCAECNQKKEQARKAAGGQGYNRNVVLTTFFGRS
ncbi:eCIS core domain-containing protein [Streptomyces echinatus]|uniref:eCIS core domain-containing protein n=1 Tax=Streptomyces echinatus TaxID=67293 RepID=UPI0037AEADD9